MALSQRVGRAARRVWNLQQRRLRSHRLIGYLDSPQLGERFSAWLNVRGWIVSLDGHPLKVVLLSGGRVLRELTPSTPRPDVEARGLPHSATCGFDARIGRDELGAKGLVRLRVVVEVQEGSGSSRHTMTVVPVRPVSGAIGQIPRAAYGRVWNDVSASLTDARISVCGTADQTEYDRSGEATASDIVREAAVGPADVVLEIGCGTGRVGSKLAPRCGRWIGCDVSENMLDHTRRALSGFSNVTLHHLNGYDLTGIEDATIDVVYCTGVFMHLDEWDRYRYVTEAFRVLKPGGRVYLDNMNLLGDEGWALFLELGRLDPVNRPPNISKTSTPEELRAYVERAGFRDIRVRPASLWVSVFAVK